MTVIVYRDGVMAADSTTWCGDIRDGRINKIKRLPDGSLFAAAGWLPVIQKAHDWVVAGADPLKKPEGSLDKTDLDAVVVRPDGAVWLFAERFEFWRTQADFVVCGSHHEFLCGALAAGASAEKAVALAIRFCKHAGGQIQVMRLRDEPC